MRRSDLNWKPEGPRDHPRDPCIAEEAGAAGYVYVLATSHRSESGLPIVKIGMTRRTPDKRVKELSRGGPTAMKLEGFVTSRDPRALERSAHQKFASSKYAAGGGTEYFSANPAEVLEWLRAASPRFEIDSARQSAWKEYCETIPYKQRSRIMLFPLYSGGVCFWVDLLFWHPNVHPPETKLAISQFLKRFTEGI